MTRSVFANSRNLSHKGSGDKSLSTAPDVCKTPVGSSTPPIPYPVVSQISDLAGGTSTVCIDGHPTAIASSSHGSCQGDEAGSASGIISGTTGSKTEFASYSFDVRLEGEGAVRHLDATTMNNRNTMGINMGAATAPAAIEEEEVEGIYLLTFQFVDELGQPVTGIHYKTCLGDNACSTEEVKGLSNGMGRTQIASTTKGETVECHLVWDEFTVARP